MKLITFTVPCYNSAAYMDHCIETLLTAGEDAEIILVDDGSKDDTGKIADAYAEKYPTIVRVIHQENGGHGEGVNQGIRNATGVYFKVVDSDDWLDTEALQKVLTELRAHLNDAQPLDLMMANYVYEHVADNTQNVVDYKGILPEGRVFTWEEIGKFPPSKNILMHSVIYRTEILRACGMELPKHTFYVDNIFVYQPLPQVKTIYYMNLDLYRYFIGREDQSVNEANMIKRVDQQLRVTRIMMNAVDVYALPPEQDKLRAYMLNYFSMMMAISSIFLTLDGSKEALAKRRQLWDDLKAHDGHLYRRAVSAFREYFPTKGLFENEVYPGIPALLANIKAAGKTVIIATSKPEAYARRILEHFGLAQYCDFICGATLDETRTDKAEVIAYALETAGITDKSRAVMVGDREHDVLGAKKNGLPCIGAVYGYGTAEELTAAGAAALADTVDELHKLLLG